MTAPRKPVTRSTRKHIDDPERVRVNLSMPAGEDDFLEYLKDTTSHAKAKLARAMMAYALQRLPLDSSPIVLHDDKLTECAHDLKALLAVNYDTNAFAGA
ncbi:hypothetical protein [Silvimonas sp.]|uniref:hypothetical protein n=1 Tax=Silvimonas sp. TaxID=2650811 RepID=UPI00283D5E09|nr:hypothetical protein [Silvimonas sp.]MDR3429702.1 hypothetical protein [Silvimonas sp.]